MKKILAILLLGMFLMGFVSADYSFQNLSGNELMHLYSNNGNLSVLGNISTGSYFVGSGKYLTDLNASAVNYWIKNGNDLYYNNGNVGIGTTSPASILDVNTGNNARLVVTENGANRLFLRSFDGATTNDQYFDLRAYDYLFKVDGGTDAVKITNNGNVGIGTTSPSHKLDVNGSISIPNLNYYRGEDTGGTSRSIMGIDNSNIVKIGAQGGSLDMALFAGDSPASMYLENGGNVGIGTTSPTSILEINGTNPQFTISGQASSDSKIFFRENGVNAMSLFYEGSAGSGTNNKFHIRSELSGSETNLVTVGLDGNVGIGTTSPDSNLQVEGTDSEIRIKSQANGYPKLIYSEDSNDAFTIGYNGSGTGSTGNKLIFNSYWEGDLLTIRGDGNVGIGTTSPGAKLHIIGADTDNTDVLKIVSNAATRGSFAVRNGVGVNPSFLVGSTGTSETLGLMTAGSEKVRITSTGNVGIGTTSPTTNLHVNGSGDIALKIESDGTSAGQSSINMVSGGTQKAVMGYYNGFMKISHSETGTTFNDNQFVINEGNVGIGTTSPSAKLEVWGNSGDTRVEVTKDGSGYVQLGYDTIGSYIYERNASNPFRIYTGAMERVRILNNGNVGIGTTSPGAILEVQTTGSGNLFALGKSGSANRLVIDNSGNMDKWGNIRFRDTRNPHIDASDGTLNIGSGGSTVMTVTGGNVGIGTTSPSELLSIKVNANRQFGFYKKGDGAGSIKMYDPATSDNNRVLGFEGQYLSFYTGSSSINTTTEQVRITSGGNVGIGTTSPNYKLDVNGSINSNSNIYINGSPIATSSSANLTGAGSTNYLSKWTGTNNLGNSVVYDDGTNVGIGTTSPNQLIHIKQDSIATDPSLALYGRLDTNAKAVIDFQHDVVNGNDYPQARIESDLGSSSGNGWADLLFFTRNQAGTLAERMRIDDSGNVGIGTTSPGALLHVSGGSSNTRLKVEQNAGDADTGPFVSMAASVFSSGSGTFRYEDKRTSQPSPSFIWNVADSSGTINAYDFQTGDTSRLMIEQNGNVGIGTTSPGAKLDVVGGDIGTNLASYSKASFIQDGSIIAYAQGLGSSKGSFVGAVVENVTGAFGGQFIAYDDSANPDWLIGLSKNTGGATDSLYYMADSLAAKIPFAIEKAGGVGIGGLDADVNPKLYVQSTGNVGIGTTSPGALLHVSGGRILVDNTYGYSIKSSAGTAIQIMTVTASDNMNIGNVNFPGDFKIDTGSVNDAVVIKETTGNVGIGTTSPSEKLEINGTNPFIGMLVAGASGGQTGIVYKTSGGSDIMSSGVYDGGGGTTREFRVASGGNLNTNVRFTVEQDGNVGIGTTTPYEKLNVMRTGAGDIARFADDSSTKGLIIAIDSSGSPILKGTSSNQPMMISPDGYLAFETDGFERMRILQGGNVGIGTTSPGAKLDVNGSTYADSITLSRGSSTPIGKIWAGSSSTSDGLISLYYGASENVRLRGSGDSWIINSNVGIGTTSPSGKLHIDSNTLFDLSSIEAGQDTLFITDNSAGGGEGNVFASIGFGTSGSARRAAIAALQTGTGTDADRMGLAFYVHPSGVGANDLAEKMRLTNAGNVGIGTTSPNYKLDVNGTIKASKTVLIGSANITTEANGNVDVW